MKERDLSDIVSALWRRVVLHYYQGRKETPTVDYVIESHKGLRYFNFLFNGEATGVGRTLVFFEKGRTLIWEKELLGILSIISRQLNEGNWVNFRKPEGIAFCHCRGYYSGILFNNSPCMYCKSIHPSDNGYIYFIRDHTRVKIGYSRNPARRLAQFRTVLPGILEMYTEPGNMTLEKYYHEWFKEYSLGGEWFQWNYELQTFLSGKGDLARNLYNEPIKPI